MSANEHAGPCFFCAEVPPVGGGATLDEAETHHASASRRVRVGDEISLIDGRGTRAAAVVGSVSHRALAFTVHERRRLRPPNPSVAVACAVPKGERLRTMIDMLSQLGVTAFVPLVCERSTVKPRHSLPDRWRRVAIEACKQSRNPYVPEIHEPCSVQASLAGVGDKDVIGFADIDGGTFQEILPDRGALHLYVGPEGGFTDAEIALLRACGAQPVSLGSNTLRVETAAVAGAALSLLAGKHDE